MERKSLFDELTGELLAADVALQLTRIAQAQHRITVALASDHRAIVLRHLEAIGITEAAAQAFADLPMTASDLDSVIATGQSALASVGELRRKVRAVATATGMAQ